MASGRMGSIRSHVGRSHTTGGGARASIMPSYTPCGHRGPLSARGWCAKCQTARRIAGGRSASTAVKAMAGGISGCVRRWRRASKDDMP